MLPRWLTGQRLASAAVSLRPGSKDLKSREVVRDKKKGRDTDGQDAGSVAGAQPAVNGLDTSKSQVGEPSLVLLSEQCAIVQCVLFKTCCALREVFAYTYPKMLSLRRAL